MISLVGPATSTEFALPLVTPELQSRLDRLYDYGRLTELVNPHALLTPLVADFATPPETDWPRPRLGVVHWPIVGLARYAFASMLVDEFTLGQLRSQMTSAGSNAITVRFRDAVAPPGAPETPRDVPMRFLSARPLVRTAPAATPLTLVDDDTPVDAWVVFLVDDRYRLLHQSATSLSTGTWSAIFAAGGVSIGDLVDTDYLTPGTRWTTDRVAGRSLAWLMDIAALSVGSRIVTVPGGAPTLQRPTPANALVLSSADDALIADVRRVGGGAIDTLDSAGGMPNLTRVFFGGPTDLSPAHIDVTVQTTYAWPSSSALTHWADAPATTSGGLRSALAAQFEADWYDWQGGLYDTLYAGFVAAAASGFYFTHEWDYSSNRGTTRFSRPPVWYGYLQAPQVASSGSAGRDGRDGHPGFPLTPEDPEDGLTIPGPRGRDGSRGPRGIAIPGPAGEDGEEALFIPGKRGRDGRDGPAGRPGVQGLGGEEAESPLVVPGKRGPKGDRGQRAPIVPGIDGEEAEYPLVIPGRPGRDGRTITNTKSAFFIESDGDYEQPVFSPQVKSRPVFAGGYIGGTYAITANATYQDTGLITVRLPVPGTYLITGNIGALIQATVFVGAFAYIETVVHDYTNNTDVPGTDGVACYAPGASSVNNPVYGSMSFSTLYTVTQPVDLRYNAFRTNGTYSVSQVGNNGFVYTNLTAVKVN